MARSTREITAAIEQARQTLAELQNRVATGKIERKYLEQTVETLQQLTGELAEERTRIMQNERVAQLYNLSRLINSSLDLQTVLQQVMDAIIELTGAERGFLMLLDEHQNLQTKVARNIDQETIDSKTNLSRTIIFEVLETGKGVVTTNALEDPRFSAQKSIMDNAMRSIMASPLRTDDKILGMMYVDNHFRTGLFSDEDLNLLSQLGEQAAVAIKNALQVQEREKALHAEINDLRIAVDETRKQRQVTEIMETEYFQKLSEAATRFRDHTKSSDETPDN